MMSKTSPSQSQGRSRVVFGEGEAVKQGEAGRAESCRTAHVVGRRLGEEPARRGVRRSPEGERKEALFRVPENRDGQSVLCCGEGRRAQPPPSLEEREGRGRRGLCFVDGGHWGRIQCKNVWGRYPAAFLTVWEVERVQDPRTDGRPPPRSAWTRRGRWSGGPLPSSSPRPWCADP